MELIHENIILADRVHYFKDFFNKARGLRFSPRLKKGHAIILAGTTESQIETIVDMLFVFFPIDIIWTDHHQMVVDLRIGVKPFTPLLIPRKAAQYVIELPANTAMRVRIGDKISFELNE